MANCYFVKKVAVAIMDGNYLLRTEDAGASWQIVSPKIKAGFTRVAFNSKGQGWAVGENGSFYHSLDRAKTWQKVNDLPPDLLHCDWSGINFADGRFGIVVGNNGVIATTKDGGTTWIKTKPSIQENLRSVYLQNHKGLITGEQTVYRLTALE